MTELLPDVIPARIRAKIRVDASSGCWLWQGSKAGSGYGSVYWIDRMRPVHRVVWELVNGPIPDGLEPDHTCEVKPCCNPACLELVTHAENMRRAISSRRRRQATHCQRGHEFSPENTGISSHGNRFCRTCMRANQLAHYHRKKVSA